MADTRDKVGRAGVFLAGGVFKIALYICVIVFDLGWKINISVWLYVCSTSRL